MLLLLLSILFRRATSVLATWSQCIATTSAARKWVARIWRITKPSSAPSEWLRAAIAPRSLVATRSPVITPNAPAFPSPVPTSANRPKWFAKNSRLTWRTTVRRSSSRARSRRPVVATKDRATLSRSTRTKEWSSTCCSCVVSPVASSSNWPHSVPPSREPRSTTPAHFSGGSATWPPKWQRPESKKVSNSFQLPSTPPNMVTNSRY